MSIPGLMASGAAAVRAAVSAMAAAGAGGIYTIPTTDNGTATANGVVTADLPDEHGRHTRITRVVLVDAEDTSGDHYEPAVGGVLVDPEGGEWLIFDAAGITAAAPVAYSLMVYRQDDGRRAT